MEFAGESYVPHSLTNSAENFVHKISKSHADCQNQVRDLIQKPSPWRDLLEEEMSNIMSTYASYMDIGFNGLVGECNDLKTQNNLLQKERNVLLETIEKLNREMREMDSKISSFF